MARKTLERGLIQVYTGDGKGKTTFAWAEAMPSRWAPGTGCTWSSSLRAGKQELGKPLGRLEPVFKIFRLKGEGFSGRLDQRKEGLRRKLKPLNLSPAWYGSRALES